jgi:hypothetical protein
MLLRNQIKICTCNKNIISQRYDNKFETECHNKWNYIQQEERILEGWEMLLLFSCALRPSEGTQQIHNHLLQCRNIERNPTRSWMRRTCPTLSLVSCNSRITKFNTLTCQMIIQL